jgi:hypothetical protein
MTGNICRATTLLVSLALAMRQIPHGEISRRCIMCLVALVAVGIVVAIVMKIIGVEDDVVDLPGPGDVRILNYVCLCTCLRGLCCTFLELSLALPHEASIRCA